MGRPKILVTHICEWCDEPFEPRQPDGRLNRTLRFCGRSCSSRYASTFRPVQVRTPEWNAKIGAAQRGEKGNNWRGGVWLSQPQWERKTNRYKALRKKIFERDDYTCVLCGKCGGDLHVDHIKSYSKHKDLRYEESNLRTLCVKCHRNTPTYGRG